MYEDRRHVLADDVEEWTLDEIGAVEDAFGQDLAAMHGMRRMAALLAVSIKRDLPDFDLREALSIKLGAVIKLEDDQPKTTLLVADPGDLVESTPGVVLTPTSAVSKPAHGKRVARKSA